MAKVRIDEKNLVLRGVALFVGYAPEAPSQHAGKVLVHHFGDTSEPTDTSHPACSECGFIRWQGWRDTQVPRPDIYAQGRFKRWVIPDVQVGSRGIMT
mgnify:FL=1